MSSPQELPTDEITITGIPASPGVVVGTVYLHDSDPPTIENNHISKDQVPRQIACFNKAKDILQRQWRELMHKESASSEESNAILEAQIEIISDPELSEQIELYIEKERNSAQQAIHKAFTNYIRILSKSDNENMKNRMIDISDIRDRLIEMTGEETPSEPQKEGDILVAKELSPREVIQLSHQDVRGFVMENGGHTSHAAIIARSMGIPAVVGAKGLLEQLNGSPVLYLNGENGLITINPSEDTRERAITISVDKAQSLDAKLNICEKNPVTPDGYPFRIQANVEFPEELQHVKQFCAEGIGLLRTESVYLDDEEYYRSREQVDIYREVLERTGEQSVTIRLLDIGGDKFRENDMPENNPFLGWRGIRMLLDERDILREQLQAILRTSAEHPGRIKILIPMVSTSNELKEVRKEIRSCRMALREEGIDADSDIPVGIMVEVPNVAVQAKYFARQADFLSIGTNDLTQYLLAVDRGNARLSGLYDQQHPVMWKVIDHVIRSAEEEGVEVEVCGELASYPAAAACLVGLGVGSLSMSPMSIPQVKKTLLSHTYDDMQALAQNVLHCEELEEIHSLFNHWDNQQLHEQ